MILHAVHPSLMLRVPARARNVKVDWQRTVTPVEIAEISASETRSVEGLPLTSGKDGDELALTLFDGRLFTPLRAAGRLADATDLSVLIEGTVVPGTDPAFVEDLRRHLRDSPLVLPYRDTPRYLPHAIVDDRGDELGPPRLVRHDGESEARANVTAYTRDDLLLVGGIPHVRIVPLARVFRDRDGVHARIMTHGGMASLSTGPVAPACFEAATRVTGKGEGRILLPDGFDVWKDLPGSVFGDRARETAANCMPGLVRMALDRMEGPLRQAADPAWRKAMADWETRGLNRSLLGEGVDAPLRDCLMAMAAVSNQDPLKRMHDGGEFGKVSLAMLREVHVPRPGAVDAVPAVDLDLEEDSAAFAAL